MSLPPPGSGPGASSRHVQCLQLCFPSFDRYEVLFAPQPPAASCQFLSSVELTLQHQAAETNERVLHHAERLKAEGTTAAACEEQLQEIEHCISVFLRENEEPGALSLAGIITSALCTLCRLERYFIYPNIRKSFSSSSSVKSSTI